MRFLMFASLLALSACGTEMFEPPVSHQLPTTGQIVYSCANGAQLAVDYSNGQAQVAIVGGPSMVLPSTTAGAQTYSNGRYTLQGGGATAMWDTPSGDPTQCRGS